MIRRDWVKRQVEIMAQTLGTVLGLRGKGDIQAAAARLEEAIRSISGLSGKLALGLSLDDFIRLACRGEKPQPEFLSSLADLFEAWAGLLRAQGRPGEADSAGARAQGLRNACHHGKV